ncbi:ABC transporter substrate-binding protein [Mesorhizobium sp. M4A.F.Ca.ET.022.05.2.1]|uniref:ABC transporter substrate-binding protein n=1 Tax=Mesorhizobium sp. M4A.F.Ca.ET.022.05.2.1 TaxID=2496653 RepID=UPI000FCB22E1|nr:ABC transporter substrate-binding protein [Mesorhizobium sp. M4A.F.Ca.ET.022.05.2.1]RVC80955.1 ABC transporter substrate-binding protein [Mesorhizobium sp. M4A.F.Ca.ET.022.05.2.1]
MGGFRNELHSLAVLVAGLIGMAMSAGTAQATDTVTIATSIETLDAFVPQFGSQVGIFARHDLDINYVKGANGSAMVAAVVGGSADITHVGAALIFPAIQKGAALTVLLGNYDIDYTFIAHKDAEVDVKKGYPAFLNDLKGKLIGVAGRGGATELYVRKMFTDAGMNPDKDITFIAIGTGYGAAGAFTNRQVDAMASIPPSSTLIGPDNLDVLVDLNATRNKVFDPEYLFTVFTANSDFIKNRPQVAQNFCKAVIETISYMKDPANEQKLVDFTAKTLKLDAGKAKALIDVYKSGFNAKLTKERWEGMKKYAAFVPDWTMNAYEPCASLTSG